jgi:hypothetical protein
MTRARRTAAALLATAAAGILPAGAAAHPAPAHEHADGQLSEVRRATARFHSVREARRAGYERASECVQEPGQGGMGYHYVHPDLAADRKLDPRAPEALLYEPTASGRLHLVAVEYIRADADQNKQTDDDRPSLFGVPFDGPMDGHSPGQPIHYDLHAWVWKHNPSGTFAQYNPDVSCPDAPASGA